MNSAQTIRDFYQAALDGDLEKFFSYIEDDFELHEPPFLPYAKVYQGREGFKELFAEATKVLDLPTMTVEYAFGEGERACAVIECGLNHRPERARILEEWIVRDGKVRWGHVYWFDPSLAGPEND